MPESLKLEREFPADPARVFRAWTEPIELARWAWGKLGHSVTAQVDLRPGGEFRVSTTRPDGSVWSFSGTYLEVDPERRLAHTLRWDAPMGYPPAEESVTVEFSPSSKGTKVAFVHDGIPDAASRDGHDRGWSHTFDVLHGRLESEQAAHGAAPESLC